MEPTAHLHARGTGWVGEAAVCHERQLDRGAPCASALRRVSVLGDRENTNAAECDAFYERLAARFSITLDGGGLTFMIGMDISLGDGWVK